MDENSSQENLSYQDRLAMAKLNGFNLYTVSGVIINNPYGPRCYVEDIAALNAEMAWDIAVSQVAVQCSQIPHA